MNFPNIDNLHYKKSKWIYLLYLYVYVSSINTIQANLNSYNVADFVCRCWVCVNRRDTWVCCWDGWSVLPSWWTDGSSGLVRWWVPTKKPMCVWHIDPLLNCIGFIHDNIRMPPEILTLVLKRQTAEMAPWFIDKMLIIRTQANCDIYLLCIFSLSIAIYNHVLLLKVSFSSMHC